MMIFGIGGKYCPACRSRMNVRITTHRAVDAEGQTVVYHGVRYYTCPQGCHTSMYDFRDAYIDDPVSGPRGWQPFGTRRSDAWPLGFLGKLDLAFVLTVFGLIVGYTVFLLTIVVSHTSPGGKIASGVALTIAAFYVLFVLTQRKNGGEDEGEQGWGSSAGAH